MSDSYTPKLNLVLPDFNISPWHDKVNNNMRLIDAAIYSILGLANIKGPFVNSTAVSVGEKYFDPVSSVFYEVVTSYVTGPAPLTFAQERVLNPTKWTVLEVATIAGAVGIVLDAQTSAAASAAAASTSASTVTSLIPAIVGKALNYTRANAGETSLEYRTPAQVRSDIGICDDNENRIINGDFGIWQRGTSSAALGLVAADRWMNDFVGGTVTQSRQSYTVGTLFGSVCPAFFLRQAVSGQSAVSHYAKTVQRIEGVRSYAGQTITVLFNAGRSAGGGSIAVEAYQVFGTGGSPSAAVSTGGQIVAITGAFGVYAVTIAIPSIIGKTIGTNNNDYLEINFWTSAGSNFSARAASLGIQTVTVDLWGIHIRVGTWTAADAALYRPRDPGTERALCRRYYRTNPTLQGALNAAASAFVCPGFGEDMRSGTPVISLRNGTAAYHNPTISFLNILTVTGSVAYLSITLSANPGALTPGQVLAGALQADDEL